MVDISYGFCQSQQTGTQFEYDDIDIRIASTFDIFMPLLKQLTIKRRAFGASSPETHGARVAPPPSGGTT